MKITLTDKNGNQVLAVESSGSVNNKPRPLTDSEIKLISNSKLFKDSTKVRIEVTKYLKTIDISKLLKLPIKITKEGVGSYIIRNAFAVPAVGNIGSYCEIYVNCDFKEFADSIDTSKTTMAPGALIHKRIKNLIEMTEDDAVSKYLSTLNKLESDIETKFKIRNNNVHFIKYKLLPAYDYMDQKHWVYGCMIAKVGLSMYYDCFRTFSVTDPIIDSEIYKTLQTYSSKQIFKNVKFKVAHPSDIKEYINDSANKVLCGWLHYVGSDDEDDSFDNAISKLKNDPKLSKFNLELDDYSDDGTIGVMCDRKWFKK